MDLRYLARDERTDLAGLLGTLSPQQWEAPTLCTGWRVRDVVAHVVSYDGLDARALWRRLVQGRFVPSRVNAAAMAEYERCSPEQLRALLQDQLRLRGLYAALGGRMALAEGLIHHQDIRRALGLPRSIPPERLVPALWWALMAPDISGLWRIRGVRLMATDLDFSVGVGPEARGAGDTLLMAMAGRRGVVNELSGPGQRRLASRLDSF